MKEGKGEKGLLAHKSHLTSHYPSFFANANSSKLFIIIMCIKKSKSLVSLSFHLCNIHAPSFHYKPFIPKHNKLALPRKKKKN